MEEFKIEVAEAVAYASTLRNNIPARWSEYFAGGGGLVVKICFEDGVCWADKMFASSRQMQSAAYGEGVMRVVHEYCPNIPLPGSKAWIRLRLYHHMTDWVEGTPLIEKVFQVGSEYYTPNATTFRIPRKVVNPLAEFMFNLSTCSIPTDLRTPPVNGEMTIP